jgi:hypothetical protein
MYEKQKAKSIKKIENQINSMAPILSQIQLDNLVKHKYTSAGSTLFDPIFQPYWCWCVEKLPMNLAPNLITLIGLLLNVVTSLLVILYSPNATEDVRESDSISFFVFFFSFVFHFTSRYHLGY